MAGITPAYTTALGNTLYPPGYTPPAGVDIWASAPGPLAGTSIGQIMANQKGIQTNYLPTGVSVKDFVTGVGDPSTFQKSGVTGASPVYTPMQIRYPGETGSDQWHQVIPANTAYYIDAYNNVHFGTKTSDGNYTFSNPGQVQSGTALESLGWKDPNWMKANTTQTANGFTISGQALQNLSSQSISTGLDNGAFAKKETGGLGGIIGSVLSVASIVYPPLAPIAAAVNAVNAVATGNIGGLLSSVLPYVPGVSGLTSSITSSISSGLGVSQATAQALTNAGIAGGITGITGGGLQNALTNAAIAGVGTLAKPTLSGIYDNLTGSTSGLAPNQFYGPDGQILTDNFSSGSVPSPSSTPSSIGGTSSSGLQSNQFYGPDGEVLTDAYNSSLPTSATNQAPVTDGSPTPVSNPTTANPYSELAKGLLGTAASGAGTASGVNNVTGLLAGLYGKYAADRTASNLTNAANSTISADPYHDYIKNSVVPFMNGLQDTSRVQNIQGQQYADQYAKTYKDPLSIYNTPEMQALSSVFNQGIERRDAAAGRNSQYGARAVEEQNNFLTNSLPQYRTGLSTMYNNLTSNANKNAALAIPGFSGSAGVPSASTALNGAATTSANQYAGLVGPAASILNSIFN